MDPVAKTKLIESLYEVLESASILVLEKHKVVLYRIDNSQASTNTIY